MRGVLAAAVLILAGSASAQMMPEGAMFKGGPAGGMTRGKVLSRSDAVVIVAAEASQPNASPPPRAEAKAVAGLIRAYETGVSDRSGISVDAKMLFCRTWSQPCETGAFSRVPLEQGYKANTPYYLPDHRIRIEWMKARKVEFNSFVTLNDGKVTRVETVPSSVPMTIPANHG